MKEVSKLRKSFSYGAVIKFEMVRGMLSSRLPMNSNLFWGNVKKFELEGVRSK